MKKTGTFIVIDGTDGSGKATQTKLLLSRMEQEGFPIKTISFPRYGEKSCGAVEEYLSGKYGSAQDVGPQRSSIFYAIDRHDAAPQIRTWLESGNYVIADRYVGANMGHHGSKIHDNEERQKFFDWAMHLEFEIFQIPVPDLNIILHVPTEIALELTKERESKHGLKKDIHESDPGHLHAAEKAYLDITKRFDQFQLIKCVEDGKLLSRDAIHEKIWRVVCPLL